VIGEDLLIRLEVEHGKSRDEILRMTRRQVYRLLGRKAQKMMGLIHGARAR
jgi:hypothetical protein